MLRRRPGSPHRSSAPVRPWEKTGRGRGGERGAGCGVRGGEGGRRSSLALAISDPPKVCSSRVSTQTLVTRLLAAISLPNPSCWAICSER